MVARRMAVNAVLALTGAALVLAISGCRGDVEEPAEDVFEMPPGATTGDQDHLAPPPSTEPGTMPTNWPEDVPVHPDFSPVMAMPMEPPEGRIFIRLSGTVEASLDEMYDWYVDALEAEGWELDYESPGAEKRTLGAVKGDGQVSVELTPGEDTVVILYTVDVPE